MTWALVIVIGPTPTPIPIPIDSTAGAAEIGVECLALSGLEVAGRI